MTYEAGLFFCVLGVLAGLPAAVIAGMPGLRNHPAWKRVLVFVGALIWLLPLALVPALIIMFQVFGIDMVD